MHKFGRSHEKIALAALMLAAIVWGSGFVATRLALDTGFGIAWVLLGRFFLTSVIFGLIFKKDLKFSRQDLLLGGLAGIVLFAGFALQILALQLTTPARNAFITATYVVLVPFLGWLVTRKRPGWHVFTSALLCLAGIGILSFSGQGGNRSLWGDALTFLCAVSFAAHFIILERAVQKVKLGRLLFLQMAVVTVLSCLFLPFPQLNQLPVKGQSADWLAGLAALLYLALFCSVLAYAIQTTAQKYTSSAKAALILSAEALWGSLFSVLFGYEPLSWRLALGGLLILISVILTELPAVRAKKALSIQYEEDQ